MTEPPTFSSVVDLGGQAATLVVAAAEGKPFWLAGMSKTSGDAAGI
jgi:hypothetical protein